MNDLQIFENSEFGAVRTLIEDGKPLFCGKDVAKALGYANESDALNKHLHGVAKCYPIQDSLGRTQDARFITEGDVYRLVFGSKLPNAEKFTDWVTDEVLPAIRKHGAYATPETIEQMLSNPDTMIRVLTELKAEQDKRKALEAQAEKDKPKLIFAESVAASDGTILIGELAKIMKGNGIDIGQNRLFQRLRDDGYLMSKGESYNMPSQRAMELGLFKIKERTIVNPDESVRITKTTLVTGKGQLYFINHYMDKKEVAV